MKRNVAGMRMMQKKENTIVMRAISTDTHHILRSQGTIGELGRIGCRKELDLEVWMMIDDIYLEFFFLSCGEWATRIG